MSLGLHLAKASVSGAAGACGLGPQCRGSGHMHAHGAQPHVGMDFCKPNAVCHVPLAPRKLPARALFWEADPVSDGPVSTTLWCLEFVTGPFVRLSLLEF